MAVKKTINKDRSKKQNHLTYSQGTIALFPVARKQNKAIKIERKDPLEESQKSPREKLAAKKDDRNLELNLSAPQPRKENSPKKQENKRDLPVDRVNKKPDRVGQKIQIKHQKKRQELPLFAKLCLYSLRLLIVGVGLGTIAGTILSSLDLTSSMPLVVVEEEPPKTETQTPIAKIPGLTLNRELTSVKNQIVAIVNKYPKMQPRVFFFDLDDGGYIDIEANTPTSAASTIKIPILIAFFQDIDAGKIALDEMLTMNKEAIARGSGSMQYRKPGTKFTALETATKTIVISDNTGTNMLIDRLGGAEVLNKRFRSWGMKNTVINNPLPDLKGTNTTSSFDLAYLLALVERGDLLSLRSRDRLFAIMKKTRTKTLLPQGLGKGAVIAHKTGDIGTILADAGLIDLPNGKRYLAAVMVKRPYNNYSARTMIQEISRTAYKHFDN